mmetsp:Transcript_71232/g.143406  ORF Transcript_71232/g.143406 Transcript_71232/m.143406 type:complete len:254 (-) Transcript_71232:9-770(-)
MVIMSRVAFSMISAQGLRSIAIRLWYSLANTCSRASKRSGLVVSFEEQSTDSRSPLTAMMLSALDAPLAPLNAADCSSCFDAAPPGLVASSKPPSRRRFTSRAVRSSLRRPTKAFAMRVSPNTNCLFSYSCFVFRFPLGSGQRMTALSTMTLQYATNGSLVCNKRRKMSFTVSSFGMIFCPCTVSVSRSSACKSFTMCPDTSLSLPTSGALSAVPANAFKIDSKGVMHLANLSLSVAWSTPVMGTFAFSSAAA